MGFIIPYHNITDKLSPISSVEDTYYHEELRKDIVS